MKKTIIITIIVCLALAPFMFGDIAPFELNLPQIEVTNTRVTDKHKIGTGQGEGDARPLDDIVIDTNTLTAEIYSNGLSKTDTAKDNKSLIDYPIVVFIVSTEETGEINGMNSTAIICYTMLTSNGKNCLWRGGNGGWADFGHLYYSVQASGNKNGLTSVRVTEYMLGKKSDRTVYVRQIIGIRSEAYE